MKRATRNSKKKAAENEETENISEPNSQSLIQNESALNMSDNFVNVGEDRSLITDSQREDEEEEEKSEIKSYLSSSSSLSCTSPLTRNVRKESCLRRNVLQGELSKSVQKNYDSILNKSASNSDDSCLVKINPKRSILNSKSGTSNAKVISVNKNFQSAFDVSTESVENVNPMKRKSIRKKNKMVESVLDSTSTDDSCLATKKRKVSCFVSKSSTSNTDSRAIFESAFDESNRTDLSIVSGNLVLSEEDTSNLVPNKISVLKKPTARPQISSRNAFRGLLDSSLHNDSSDNDSILNTRRKNSPPLLKRSLPVRNVLQKKATDSILNDLELSSKDIGDKIQNPSEENSDNYINNVRNHNSLLPPANESQISHDNVLRDIGDIDLIPLPNQLIRLSTCSIAEISEHSINESADRLKQLNVSSSSELCLHDSMLSDSDEDDNNESLKENHITNLNKGVEEIQAIVENQQNRSTSSNKNDVSMGDISEDESMKLMLSSSDSLVNEKNSSKVDSVSSKERLGVLPNLSNSNSFNYSKMTLRSRSPNVTGNNSNGSVRFNSMEITNDSINNKTNDTPEDSQIDGDKLLFKVPQNVSIKNKLSRSKSRIVNNSLQNNSTDKLFLNSTKERQNQTKSILKENQIDEFQSGVNCLNELSAQVSLNLCDSGGELNNGNRRKSLSRSLRNNSKDKSKNTNSNDVSSFGDNLDLSYFNTRVPRKSKLELNKIMLRKALTYKGKKIEGMEIDAPGNDVYKTRELKKPNKWVTNNLYNFIIPKLQPKYGIKSQKRAEIFIDFLCKKFGVVVKDQNNSKKDIDEIILEMAKLKLINCLWDFYIFVGNFLPREFCLKSVPEIRPFGRESFVESLPRDKYFTSIL